MDLITTRCGNFVRSAADGQAWGAAVVQCPDCGAQATLLLRQTDRFPFTKIRAHNAPEGVVPSPYAVLRSGFVAWPPP